MNGQTFGTERLSGVHLSILIVLSVACVGVSASAVTLDWAEVWMVPFLVAGVLVCWILHIRQVFSPGVRIFVYAFVSFAAIVLDGVQPTSIFDFSISVVLAMTLFSQADSVRLLHLCFLVYLYLLANQIVMLASGKGVAVTGLVISELVIHTFIVFVIYRIAVSIVRRRLAKAAEEEKEIEELKEMQKRTEDFLTNVSHELRTPINAVTGIGSAMIRDAKGEAAGQRARAVFFAGRRLGSQVEDMLDYTEIDTGKLVIAEEPYAISSLVNDVASECGYYEEDIAKRIVFEVLAGIPERLTGGGRWIRKMLLHQTETAVTYAGEGDIRVRVYAKKRDYGINLCMEVRYEGAPVSRARLARISGGYFSQEETTQHTLSAFDVGIRILYGLAHAMGGFVRVARGNGTENRIHVSVPQRIASDADVMRGYVTEHTVIRVEHKSDMSEEVRGTASAIVPEGLRTLIVDDEPMNLLVAESIFSDYGMVTDTANSGAEAIEKVRGNGYDLIFMDHMMPEMDGVEAAHRIRDVLAAQERDTRIVALTANAVSGARELFMKEGFDGFVAKPVARAELERTLKELQFRG